jgi:hypothetical protein
MIIYYRDAVAYRYLKPLDILAAENSDDIMTGKV